jgi:hypothetical protein
LLRSRRERPRCRAAERGYELPPSSFDCHFTHAQRDHARCYTKEYITARSGGL